MNLIQVLIEKNKSNRNKAAIHYYEKFCKKRVLTFGQLFDEVEQKSKLLKANDASGFVLLCLEHPIDFIISFMALVHSGCVPIPLPPVNVSLENIFVNRLKQLFSKYEFDFIITDKISKSYFSNYECPILDSTLCFEQGQFVRKTQPLHPDACFIQFSSGSTSDPKGIVINHHQLLCNLDQIYTALSPSETDKLITWLPLYHDMGLIGAILSPIFAKAEVHVMSTRDYLGNTDKYLDLIIQEKINFILGPDFMYRQLAKILLTQKYDLSHLKVCMSGAELVLPSTTKQFQNALVYSNCHHAVFRPVYGMAEACLGVTFNKSGDFPRIAQMDDGREVVSCGYPLKNQSISIVNSKYQNLKNNEIGEVVISGDSLFTEYYMNKDQKLVTSTGLYLTGDEGFIQNQQLYLLGRKKDTLIINGQKYHSLDLENYIYENLKKVIGRVACVQSEDVYIVAEIPWHYFPKAYWIRKKIENTINQRLIVEFKNIYIVPKFDLPRTTSGKIQRYKVIQKIDNKKYNQSFYFIKSIFKLIKEIKGLTR
jgi:acyl-CoA synthetase (AMP-forming)/AMP-acid ligase II